MTSPTLPAVGVPAETEKPPVEPTTEAGRRLLAGHSVGLPKHIGGWLWPAHCLDCGLTTEDPDAHYADDCELAPERCCPATGGDHRWEAVDGKVRYVRPSDILAIEAKAAAVERAAIRAEYATTLGRASRADWFKVMRDFLAFLDDREPKP